MWIGYFQFNSGNLKYTTLRRSDLIDFLKKDLDNLIKTNHSISGIEHGDKEIKLTFENNKIFECDYLIVSDGVFSKCNSILFGISMSFNPSVSNIKNKFVKTVTSSETTGKKNEHLLINLFSCFSK